MKIILISLAAALAIVTMFWVKERTESRLQTDLHAANSALEDARNSIAGQETEIQNLKAANKSLKTQADEVHRLRAQVTEQARRLAAKPAQTVKTVSLREDASAAAGSSTESPEQILAGPAFQQGTMLGNLRAKLLAGEPLTESDQALINAATNGRLANIEHSPEEFASFQSAYISSLLGVSDPERLGKMNSTILAAAKRAAQQGYDYTGPGENADAWSDQQKQLNTRATSAIQNLLTPDERNVFDRSFIGVLGIDLGIATRK